MTKKTWLIALSVLIAATYISSAIGHKLGYRKGMRRGYRIAEDFALSPGLIDHFKTYDYDVKLTDYKFEVTKKEPYKWTIVWTAWIRNRENFMIPFEYYIIFRDSYGDLVQGIGPIKGTSPVLDRPRESNSQCWIEASSAKQIDFSRSEMYIKVGVRNKI